MLAPPQSIGHAAGRRRLRKASTMSGSARRFDNACSAAEVPKPDACTAAK
jgi:hypothetical protein